MAILDAVSGIPYDSNLGSARLGGDECLGGQPANPDMGLAWIAMNASLDRSFGLPKVTVADTPHICLAGRLEKREHSHQIGSHLGYPG